MLLIVLSFLRAGSSWDNLQEREPAGPDGDYHGKPSPLRS